MGLDDDESSPTWTPSPADSDPAPSCIMFLQVSSRGEYEMDDEEMNHINTTMTRLHPTPDEQSAKDINPAWVTTALFSNCADSQTRLPNPSCPCQLRDLLPHLVY